MYVDQMAAYHPPLGDPCSSCKEALLCGGCPGHCRVCLCGECECSSCSSFCCKHENFGNVVAGFGGFSFSSDSTEKISVPNLPEYIPQIQTGRWKGKIDIDFAAFSADKVYSKKASYQLHRSVLEGIRKKFELADRTKLVLLNNGHDPIIEALWEGHRKSGLVAQYRRVGFDVVVSPDYSIFDDRPRVEHLLAMKKSLLFYEMMTVSGISSIPHIYMFNRRDTERWAEYLRHNEWIDHIAVCLQTDKNSTDSDFDNTLDQLASLRDSVGRELHLLAIGVYVTRRIAKVVRKFDRFTMTNGKTSMMALCGKRLEFISGRLVEHSSLLTPCENLLRSNQAYFKMIRFLRKLKKAGDLDLFIQSLNQKIHRNR